MNIELTPAEARAVGCLIEKQLTTPDQYPLSLNALTNACNQKSNRDPVMTLAETDVQQVLDGLVRKHLVIEKSGFGSRVPKYHQIFCNTEFGPMQFSPQETAILCELLLRGPQTPGELRSHAARIVPFGDVGIVEAALERLADHPEGPFVVRLPREPGRREARYAQLFTGEPPARTSGAATRAPAAEQDLLEERLSRLEQLVRELQAELAELRSRSG